jgi:hypothetical protein
MNSPFFVLFYTALITFVSISTIGIKVLYSSVENRLARRYCVIDCWDCKTEHSRIIRENSNGLFSHQDTS